MVFQKKKKAPQEYGESYVEIRDQRNWNQRVEASAPDVIASVVGRQHGHACRYRHPTQLNN